MARRKNDLKQQPDNAPDKSSARVTRQTATWSNRCQTAFGGRRSARANAAERRKNSGLTVLPHHPPLRFALAERLARRIRHPRTRTCSATRTQSGKAHNASVKGPFFGERSFLNLLHVTKKGPFSEERSFLYDNTRRSIETNNRPAFGLGQPSKGAIRIDCYGVSDILQQWEIGDTVGVEEAGGQVQPVMTGIRSGG